MCNKLKYEWIETNLNQTKIMIHAHYSQNETTKTMNSRKQLKQNNIKWIQNCSVTIPCQSVLVKMLDRCCIDVKPPFVCSKTFKVHVCWSKMCVKAYVKSIVNLALLHCAKDVNSPINFEKKDDRYIEFVFWNERSRLHSRISWSTIQICWEEIDRNKQWILIT